ncbi:MAG: molecular chaperone DnaJ [Gemmatimonadetes bacterium]|nr:molecular chaperone DnaJ [Gemmatimonadota bacterium]
MPRDQSGMRDYYEILGIARDADVDAVKKAYRKLALQYHPDRNDGSKESEERFREATEAYEVLRDPQKRAAYDRYGHAGVKAGAGQAGFAGFDFAAALEIFMRDFGGFGLDELFGGAGASRRRGRGAARRGLDLRVQLPVTLAEVAAGVKKTLRLQVLDSCAECAGTGSEAGSAPVRCATCGGSGEVRRVQRSILGQLVTVTPCATCGGQGQRIERLCRACQGRGVQPADKTVQVEVPAGVSTGDYITLRGSGSAGSRGGPRGDIIVVLEVQEDPRFQREGADLVYELPITFSQAALGAELEVPTVNGSARVKVPAGTQSGRLLRMRGRGLPHLQGTGRGDQIVRVIVWTPTELSTEQEEVFRRLAQFESEPPRPEDASGEGGFWSKVRGAFSA